MARHQYAPLAVLTTLFFMWGFITCMNDILIPYLKGVFSLTYFQAMFVQFSFFGAYFLGGTLYFIISSKIGDPINKIGYKNGIILGLLISAFGCLLFYPAATYSLFGFFLGALFILGLGFTLLQITANPYVSILGSEASASSRLNLAQGFNSFGTTIAPILGGYLVFEFFFDPEVVSASAVKTPYLIFAGLFLVLAVFIWLAKLPVFTNKEEIIEGAGALRYPHLVLGIGAIFMYVGGEVAIGSVFISFIELDEVAGLPEVVGKNYLALYWGGAMIGRFMGSIMLGARPRLEKYWTMAGVGLVLFGLIYWMTGIPITELLPWLGLIGLNFMFFLIGRSLPGRTLGIFALVNVILLLFAIFIGGKAAMWAIIGIGLFNSIMWSNIFTLAIARLGKYTSQGSSLLIMAILGGALIPLLHGKVADLIGIKLSFLVPIACYFYLAFYGFKGSRIKKESPLQSELSDNITKE